MTKNVLIKIIGTQEINNETETSEFTTEGRFGHRDGSFYLSYDEGEILGLKNVKALLYVKEDGTVILQRSGPMTARMVIAAGKRNTCLYNTPFGTITMGISAETVKHQFGPEGGSISLSYTIDTDLKLMSRNTLNISFREVNNNVNTCV